VRRGFPGLRRFFPKPTRAVGIILFACIAIHVVFLLSIKHAPIWAMRMLEYGALTPATVLHRPWTIITMAFLHDPHSLMHIIFNMMALWSIGPWLERALGTRRFSILYAISLLAGSLVFVLKGFVSGGVSGPAIGASGAIMGVVVGFGFVFPEVELRLFGVAPLKAKNIFWAAILVDTIMVIMNVPIAVSVHIGGMLGSWFYLRRPWNPRYRMWLSNRIRNKINWLRIKYRLWKASRP